MQRTEAKAVIVSKEEGEQVSIMGTKFIFKTTSRDTDGAQFVFESVSPPGLTVPPHTHVNEDEFFYVLEGEVDALIGERTVRLKTGDVAYLPRGVPHALSNPGTVPNRTLFITTPGGSENLYKEAEELTVGGSVDMAQFARLAGKYGITFLPPPGV